MQRFLDNLLTLAAVPLQERRREKAIKITIFFFIFLSLAASTNIVEGIIPINTTVIFLIEVALLGMVVLLTNKGQVKSTQFSIFLLVLYSVFVLSFIVASIVTYRLGSVLQGIVFLTIFPLLSIISNSEMKGRLVGSLFDALVYNFYLYFVLCIVFSNVNTQKQYAGIFINPNTLGIFCSFVIIAMLYNLYRKKSFFNLLGLGLCSITIYATQCRAALVCCILNIIIIFFVWIFKKAFRKYGIREFLGYAMGLGLGFLLIFYANPYVYQAQVYATNEIISIVESLNERVFNQEKEGREPANLSEDYKLENRKFNRLTSSVTDGGDVTSGRITLWKLYMEEISLLPNADGNENKFQNLSAHNTYLHLGYCFGAITGIGYLLYNVCIGFASLKNLMRKRCSAEALIFFLTVLNYGMMTLVETLYNPIGSIPCFLYLFVSWLFLLPKNE